MAEISEADWQAWLRKGRAKGRRQAAFRWNVIKWVCGLGLMTAGAVYSDRTPYDLAVRCLVMAGAIVAIFKALRPRVPSIHQGKESL